MTIKPNYLYNMDCLEGMKMMPDHSVDAIICDLPYGTTACAWDSIIPFEPLWSAYKRLIKPNGAIVLFGSEPFSSALRMSNIGAFKFDWIWEKSKASNFLQASYMPMKAHETISVFCYDGKPTYNPIKTEGELLFYDVIFPTAKSMYVLRKRVHFISPDGNKCHPFFGSVLIAFGEECDNRLRHLDIEGKYIKLN